ncbi:MAG: hypothetical protein ABWZ52_03095 [Acidimicrobiales bacterium]
MLAPTASTPTPDWMAGARLLPWSWAVERLETERNYWLVTVRRDGFPQARPVWGVWSELGLLLSVGHGGLQRAEPRPEMPITVHTDDAVDVVILEGVVDRVASYPGDDGVPPSLEIEPSIRRDALERYNAKYSWNLEIDGDGLNFLVRPRVAYGWHSTMTAVEGGTRWAFQTDARSRLRS